MLKFTLIALYFTVSFVAQSQTGKGDAYDVGVQLMGAKDYAGAVKSFTEYLSGNAAGPHTNEAFFHRGFCYLELMQPAQAVTDFGKVLEKEPENAKAYFERAYAYIDLKEYKKAIADLDKSLQYDALNAYAFYERGFAKRASGDCAGAVSDYDKALHIRPDYAQALAQRAYCYIDFERHTEAISDLDKAILYKPNYAWAWYERGYAKQKIGDIAGACADFKTSATQGDNSATEMIKKYCK